LITRDRHLLDMDETSLSMAFNDADWAPVGRQTWCVLREENDICDY
jgi:hypothetical protein